MKSQTKEKEFQMARTSGTKEWACKNLNFSKGCSNACKYCYARRMANRFGWKKWTDWPNMENREECRIVLLRRSKSQRLVILQRPLAPH